MLQSNPDMPVDNRPLLHRLKAFARMLLRLAPSLGLLVWYSIGVADLTAGIADAVPQWVWGLILVILSVITTAVWFETIRGKLAPEWPDYARWDRTDPLELYQAAMLWCEREPILPMGRKARKKYFELRRLVIEQGIPIHKEDGPLTIDEAMLILKLSADDKYNVHAKVDRAYLRVMAEALGERPRFLYKSERA